MKDHKQFILTWEVKRQEGKLKYVLKHGGLAGTFALIGVVMGSVLLYNSPSTYSFAYYLPTYFCVFFGVSLVAIVKFMFEWDKNEKKYSKGLNE